MVMVMKMEMHLLLGNMGEYNTKDGPNLPHYYSHTTFEYIRGHGSLLRSDGPVCRYHTNNFI